MYSVCARHAAVDGFSGKWSITTAWIQGAWAGSPRALLGRCREANAKRAALSGLSYESSPACAKLCPCCIKTGHGAAMGAAMGAAIGCHRPLIKLSRSAVGCQNASSPACPCSPATARREWWAPAGVVPRTLPAVLSLSAKVRRRELGAERIQGAFGEHSGSIQGAFDGHSNGFENLP